MAVAFLATVLASVVVVPPVVAEPPQPAKGRGDKCVMPTDWMASANHLALSGVTCSTLVNTGKATAPPPSQVAPAINEPKIMVVATAQCLAMV